MVRSILSDKGRRTEIGLHGGSTEIILLLSFPQRLLDFHILGLDYLHSFLLFLLNVVEYGVDVIVVKVPFKIVIAVHIAQFRKRVFLQFIANYVQVLFLNIRETLLEYLL